MSFYPEIAGQNIKTVLDDILIKIKLVDQIFHAYHTSVTHITTPEKINN